MEQIVVGVDGSPPSDRALVWAVYEAELRGAGISVVHCYVVHARGIVMHVPDLEGAQARLDEIIDRNRHLLDRVDWTADVVGVASAASTGLVDMAFDAALIVVGSRGAGGFERLRLGSTGYRTAAHATSPVAVIRGHADDEYEPPAALVVGIDGSHAASRALRWAVDESRRWNVALTVVHAYRPATDATTLTRTSDQRRGQVLTRARTKAEEEMSLALEGVDTTAVDVDRVLERGSAADVLLSRSGTDRLLVVGTHGRGAIGRMVFGSVSHQCLHHADGPVVVVP